MNKEILIAAGVLLSAGGKTVAEKTPPNILFICVDDLRPQTGCYGNDQMITPNMDRLAGTGVLFERAYCQFAVCGPSRASLLTGMYPEHNRVQDNVINFRTTVPDAVSLPQYFKNNGYWTAGVGKIFHHGNHNVDPASWSNWMQFPGRGYFLPENIAAQKQKQQDVAAREAAGEKLTPHQKFVFTIGGFSEAANADELNYPDGEIATVAINALRERADSDQPFFLAVGFLKPHLPFIVPEKYWDLYDREKLALPVNDRFPAGAPAWHTHDSFELRTYSDVPRNGDFDEALIRRAVHGYYAACSFIDAQIGRVLNELAALGLEENTVVVLFGDHGFHLDDNGIIGKDTNFEPAAHAPLILRVPGGRAGDRVHTPVELVDIFPTLCNAAGIAVPAQCDGKNLIDVPANDDVAAFTMNRRNWSHPYAGYSMRTDRYRYVRWLDSENKTAGEELYDYTLSPYEIKNLAESSEYKTALSQLRQRFDKESPVKKFGHIQ